MADVAVEQVRAKLAELRKNAAARRAVSEIDPVADAIEFCVGEIAETLAHAAEATRYLTPAGFARLHEPRVNVQTVRRWIREGRLEATRSGKTYLIRRDAAVAPLQRAS